MHKDSFLLVVGILIFTTPFLGIPEAWKSILLFVLAGCVLISAFLCRLTNRTRMQHEDNFVFTENNPQTQDEVGS